MKCRGCGKAPHEIEEYVIEAKEEGVTPEQWVKDNEGTYDLAQRFWCTLCYIKAGCPLNA